MKKTSNYRGNQLFSTACGGGTAVTNSNTNSADNNKANTTNDKQASGKKYTEMSDTVVICGDFRI